ncbi:extracellular solute-binding protein [Kineococcus siccus]|uniref:extracellular solute-binding protein n=1 Tax=Kineococcus siccus TaxID=2696567 RepID=UPI00196B5B9A
MRVHSLRTRTTAATSIVLLAATLGACSSDDEGGTAGGAASGPLEVWSRSTPEPAATYQKVFAAFTAKTGIEVDYQGVVEFDTQLQSRASAKDLPDVLINDAGSLGNYVSQGLLTPIDRESIAGQESIADETWQQNVGIDGETYGVPWSRQTFATVVRKDWREKLGLPVPTNWDELTALATAFGTQDPDGNGQADTYGMVIPGTAKNGYIGWWASSYIWQAGGDLLRSTGDGTFESAIDSPETRTAAEFVRTQFCTPGNTVPGAINLTTGDSPFFQEGTAGIYLTGPYQWSAFDAALGKDAYEVIPMPKGPVGTTALAEGENIYFGAGSDKADQQKALAEFLITPEAQELGMTVEPLPSGGSTQAVVRLPVNSDVDVVATTGDDRWKVVEDNYESDSRTFEWSINFTPFRQALGEGMNAIAADCGSDIDAGLKSIDEAFTAELESQDLLK